jgi:NADH dehydrogenase [ubiquinone] 1 alpha subcomplex assembly factor 6
MKMAEAGIEREALLAGKGSKALDIIVRQLDDRAAEHPGETRGLRRELPPAAMPALLLAAPARSYLRRLRRARFNPFDPRINAPDPWAVPRLAVLHFFRNI